MSKKITQLCCMATLCCASSFAGATAFQLWEQDAAGIGDYHASAAVDTDNTGIEFYNPAGMVFMKRQTPQMSFGVTYIPLDVAFKGEVTVKNTQLPIIHHTTQVRDWVHGDTQNLVPNFHLIYPLSPKWALGFGVTTPFGLATSYPFLPPLDEVATKTQLRTINANPSIAYRVNNWLGIGFGFDIQHASADFDGAVPHVYDTIEKLFHTQDKSHFSDIALGWNAGVYINASKQTQLGISYRSAVTHKATGTNTLVHKDGQETTSDISATLPLPATLYISAQQAVNHQLTVVASAERTWWSSFQNLTINNMVNPILPSQSFNLSNPFGYRDSWNIALGAHYWISPRWMLKAGGGYDWTPTSDKYRDIRLPDTNRWAAALGVHFLATPRMTWDAGWTHFFPVHDARINNAGPNGLPENMQVLTNGTARTNANVIGIQVTAFFH